jgi:hypothetical protein
MLERPNPFPPERPATLRSSDAGSIFAALLLSAGAAFAAPAPVVEYRGLTELVPAAVPPLPPTSTYPVQLVLDDDQSEGTVGVSDQTGARQFLWFNRFSTAGIVHLEEVWVLFPAGANMTVGDAVEIVIYEDPDGNPSNGATLLSSFNSTVQAVDGNTFSIYPLAATVDIGAGNDVLIGVVPRFLAPGDPVTSPAAVDTTVSAGRSWVAIWNGDPPSPPTLPPDLLIDLIDNVAPAAAGNWMIRGFGSGPLVTEVPTLGALGLAVLAAALGALSIVVMRRRRAQPEVER